MNAPNGFARPRELPYNLTHERSIIGGVILDPPVLRELASVETAMFYDHRHKLVWDAIRNLEAAHIPIDIVNIEREIQKTGKLEALGGLPFIAELAVSVPIKSNVISYAAELQLMHRNRLAIFELSAALERAYDWQDDPAVLLSETAGQLLRLEHEGKSIGVERQQRTRWYTDYADFLGDEEPDDDDAVDWVIRDLIPRSDPFLIGGPMKSGKTWSVIDLAISIARGEKWLGAFENTMGPARVLLVLLEDNIRRVRKRLWELCRARNISPHDPLLVANLKITRASLHLPDAEQKRRFIAETREWSPSVVFVDNLTRVLQGDPNSTKDAAAFARDWTEICEQTGAAVGFLHHTKKPSGDQKASDPFNELRGSNDFGACARNIIVISPLRSDGEHLSEVRMRGNLDLRRDSFTLGFERKQMLDRYRAFITDRGDVQDVKHDLSKKHKDHRAAEKKREHLEEVEHRKKVAIAICQREGGVTQARLALEFGKSSPNTFKPVIEGLVQQQVLTYDMSKKKYVFVVQVEDSEQRDLDIALEAAAQESHP